MHRRYWSLISSAAFVALFACAGTIRAVGDDAPVTFIPNDGEPVAVTSWLVSGMFPSPDLAAPERDGPRRAGYDTDFLTALGGEREARVSADTRVRLPDGSEVGFELRVWETDYVDLVGYFGSHAEVLAYLYCEVESPVEQDVYAHFGTNDAGKIWIGDELLLQYNGDRMAAKSQHAAKVHLPAGRTRVLVKIDQAGGNWGTFVEFYGASAHQRILAASHPDTVRAAMDAFAALRSEVGDPFALDRGVRDAYSQALYYAERIERDVPSGADAEAWDRQRLIVPQYFALLRDAMSGVRAGVDPHAGRAGMFEATYLSQADETAQPFTIVVPDDYSPDNDYALLLDLHGASGTHERVGNWWSSIGPADSAYFSNTIGVSVMGRGRWAGYDGLGENDVLEVIDWVLERYSVDPDRVYISGGSMGGGGSWRLAARYPDRFAAAWPDMGWPEYSTLPNLLNLPVYLNHGAQDWVVAVSHTREGVRQLKRMGSPVVYAEWPEVGHSMGADQRGEGFMSRMARHRRITDPERIRIHAEHPRYAERYWAHITGWVDPHGVAKLDARVLPGNVVSVQTENVASVTLAPPARRLTGGNDIVWMINGGHLVAPVSAGGSYDLALTDTSATVTAHTPRTEPSVRPYAMGSSRNLFYGEPLMIVYGTQSRRDTVKASIRALADEMSHWCNVGDHMEFGRVPIVTDEDVTEEQLASKNVILLGGPRDNSITERLMRLMPIRETRGALRVSDEESVDLVGRGYAFVYPNPEHPTRLAMVYGSDVPQFYTLRRGRLASWGMHDTAPHVPPDLVVEEVAQVDSAEDARWNRTVRSRNFTHDWRLKRAPETTIGRHPANRSEQVEFAARAWLAATAADYAFHELEHGDQQIGYVADEVSWADIGGVPFPIVTFEVAGADLVRFARHDETEFPFIHPAPDSAAIDPERLYRIVGPSWILWGLAGAHHYNPENVELFEDNALIERCLRREWGVAER